MFNWSPFKFYGFRPILDGDNLERVERGVDRFLEEGGVGGRAHDHIVSRGEHADNWAYQYWLKVSQ